MSVGVGLRSRSSSEATSFSSRPLPVSPSDSECPGAPRAPLFHYYAGILGASLVVTGVDLEVEGVRYIEMHRGPAA